ncbi:hypothetical protein [Rickettsiales endosymbiont of Trichoplax sp. H2]|uniref:hypothetical protein n=1 Tax=Rickettsiales endosymbiont of Trichoplax sp. H2 TaxID=2021221 RepID=UPI0012B1993D|nr:hypothetical protein [Rickettsiales endosymbiont of Trichoplax sp. H2]
MDKSKEFSDDISMRKGIVAYFCYQICDPILKYFGKTTYKEEEMAKSLENELSTFASTVRDTGVKGASSDVVKHDKVHEIIKEHDDTIKRDSSFVQKSQQSRNNITHGRI